MPQPQLSPRKAVAPEQLLYTAAQVRELDRLAIASGIAGFELMRRAGQAAFDLVQQCWPDHSPIEVFCGGGNNGGDGYVLAALAAEAGLPVRVWALAPPESLSGDAALAWQWAQRAGVAVTPWRGELPAENSVAVDAMLGIGLRGVVREQYGLAIQAINTTNVPVLAIDTPSGLCSDTGRILGLAVRASQTISFIGLKRGLFTLDALDCVGELSFADLAVPRDVYTTLAAAQLDGAVSHLNLPAMLAQWGPRPRNAHKGLAGHVLVVGGDYGMAGAALLAASAAARSGAGLVSCATRPEHIAALVAARPELMAHGVSSANELQPLLAKASVVVVGPGLGQQAWGKELLVAALAANKPTLFDADALNLIASEPQLLLSHDGPRILTPHPGEAARLLACSTASLQTDRFAAARMLAERFAASVLLKGAGTVVATDAALYLCSGGNPGMASGGMGDVLSGVIGSLVAQGLSPQRAICLGVAVHAEAADIAAEAGERGMLASDVIDQLRGVINGYAALS
ncbi:MAG: NAD(P)H-hydrate dehydratase [Zhongshania sp.]|uniref:NAD(P)H-hydrate dehydratase n=1 Tax=Zhongshania sp. TaxID=1971902 RepID=UPI00263810D7|nr:NAD(P)H-hydrate dehydratase [Zhongshania sp.]MDF1693107.1 NAD(P)H-hydrate dehydratase [Zhongshania sp.]